MTKWLYGIKHMPPTGNIWFKDDNMIAWSRLYINIPWQKLLAMFVITHQQKNKSTRKYINVHKILCFLWTSHSKQFLIFMQDKSSIYFFFLYAFSNNFILSVSISTYIYSCICSSHVHFLVTLFPECWTIYHI